MIFKYKNTSLVEEHEIVTIGELLQDYIKHLKKVATAHNYKYPESSLNLPFDEDMVKAAFKIKEKMTGPNLNYVLDIGIGGSNLGTKAIYDALYGYFDVVEPNRFPKIVFADTNDPHYLYKLKQFLGTISPHELIINVVSKSGKTTETIANLEILLGPKSKFKDRLVMTTDYDSELWQTAKDQNIPALPIPKNVGGRYSVFSPVGLFPLMCVGVNIYNLLEGAMDVRSACLDKNILKNPAAVSAIILFLNYRKLKLIHDTFVFHPELESLGKWYRQLMGESIGKEGIGFTPTVSVGSADLHSLGQLYLGGKRDKFFTFISAHWKEDEPQVPQKPIFSMLADELRSKTASEIMDALFTGVKIAYEKAEIPFVEVELTDLSERSLGKVMQFKMIEMMYLGWLLEVNAFDQPNVESFKSETRKILRSG